MKISALTHKDGMNEVNAIKRRWEEAAHIRGNTPSWEYVIKDMELRNETGAKKYNKYLTPNTDEDMLNHLYNEVLDAAVYLRTLIIQRDKGYDPNL